LFFRLLPKLDVVGSSPIARSLEVLDLEAVPIAAIRTGPGDFFWDPFRDPFGRWFSSPTGPVAQVWAQRAGHPDRPPDPRRSRASLRRELHGRAVGDSFGRRLATSPTTDVRRQLLDFLTAKPLDSE